VLSTAISVVGDTIHTRFCCANATSSGWYAWISANTASAGRNITAPSAVLPGTMYFRAMSSMCRLMSPRNSVCTALRSTGGQARLEHPLIVLERELRIDRHVPGRLGSFSRQSTRNVAPINAWNS
jgi:hypothetical protein